MSVEAILQKVGFCVANTDFRDSTKSGTTHAGPSGSYQFMAVQLSTTEDFKVGPSTAAGAPSFGILQNKPNSGEAADVAVFGVSKCVGGSTVIAPGQLLMTDSSGCLIPFTTTTVPQFCVGRSLESVTTIGEVFSAFIFGLGPQNRA